MQIAVSLKNFSLGTAAACLLLAGSALAQSSQVSRSAPQQWQLQGVNARLDHALDAQSAHVGEGVEAKLDRSVKTADGAKLPAGTQVFGKVERVQASQNGGPSSLTLRFTTAQLKSGQKLPLKVTVIGAFPPNARGGYVNSSMGGDLPPAPRHINPQDKYTQQPGLLSHIGMKSAVQGQNSVTFTDQDGNVKLKQGTYLQLGIAPQNNTGRQQTGM
jgi:hypothetical protein